MEKFYTLLADLIVVVHFLYVAFAVGGLAFILFGACLGWRTARKPWFRMVHLIAVLVVAAEAATGIVCPLTGWEYNLRHLAGGPVEASISFVARLARLMIFHDLPERVFTVTHIIFGLMVVAVFVLIPPRFGKKE